MSNKKQLLILLVLGFAVHFMFFGHPNQTVFDEVHFGKFISGYYTHEYYFDIHPPLGKLLIAGWGRLFDFRPEFSFANIGDKFPDSKYLALRFLPSLAGSLVPVVIFLLALELEFSKRAAFTAGILTALENSLLVQTRFILMDGFLILFGFLALLFYFRKKPVWAGIFAGLSFSIKWTGLTFLAAILILELFQRISKKELHNGFMTGIKLLAIPALIYFAVFAAHFSLLDKPGPGDAYVSKDFHEKNIVKKFTELNTEMYRSNQRLTADHPYSSRWYTWPFMQRPIFFWVDGYSKIYSTGNPVVWWASTAGMLMGLYLVFQKRSDRTIRFLAGAYLLNLLPFVGIHRVMFLYHYFAALLFAVLMLTYVIDKTAEEGRKKMIFAGLIIASAAAFLYFSPLSYGTPLSPKEFQRRVWLPTWQ